MAQFTVNISGYCKYIIYGSVSKELHFFWKANQPESVKAQIFPGAYIPTGNVNTITDQNNPLFLNVWKHYNNILNVDGLYPDMAHVIVTDQDNHPVWASDTFVDPTAVEQFNEITDIPSGWYINTWRKRKGDYGTAIIEDSKFCPDKLTYQHIAVNQELLVHRFFYDGVELQLTEGLLGDTDLGYKFLKIK